MKICHLIPNLEFGGAQKIVVGLSEEAKLQNHEVTIISLYGANDYSHKLKGAKINYINLNYKHSFQPNDLFNLFKLRKNIIGILEQLNIDIVHTHLFLIKLVLFKSRALYNIPVVDTQHDNSPWWVAKSFGSKFKTFIERDFAKRTANKIVAISQSVEKGIITTFQVKKEKVCLIYNFIELSPKKYARVDYTFSADAQFKILMLSRLQMEKKGFDIAYNIYKELFSKNRNYKLIMVGDGPDSLAIQKKFASNEFGDSVEFIGYTENIEEQYNSAHIVLMPSRWEGFGLTAAESAFMGVPVVASNVGGLNEVVKNCETGYLCSLNKIESYVSAIETLRTNAELYNEISYKARIDAKSRFLRKSAFQKYHEVYIELSRL